MSAIASDGRLAGSVKALWARAGLWRLCLMSATLLTLLVALFPPEMQPNGPLKGPPVTEGATYSPKPTVPSEIAPQLSAQVPASTQAAGIPGSSHAAQPSPAAPGIAPATGSTIRKKDQRVDTAPRTADIALANPGRSNAGQDASGIDAALMGRTYSGSVVVNGYKLPLPPGKWAMLANSGINGSNASGMAYFLGRIENRRLVGGVRVVALKSKGNPGAGFTEFKRCKSGEPNNSYTFIESVVPFDHEACWFIYNYYTPPWQQWADRAVSINNLERAAAGDMAAKGVTYPQDLVGVQFGRAEKWGLLEVAYLFSPEAEGISSNSAVSFRDTDWHAGNVNRFPAKAAYIAKMEDWGKSFWPQIKAAFSAEEPVREPASSIAPTIVERALPSAAGSALDIRMGDNVATVKSILKSDLDPQPMSRNPALPANVPDMTAGKSVLHLADKGIWVFFDQTGKVYSVRLDAPYPGDIRGIRLGDDLGKVNAVFGDPPATATPAFGNLLAYRYALDDTRHVRFDMSGDKVRYIFITR